MAEQVRRYPPSILGTDRDTEIEVLLEASEIAATHTLDFHALMDGLATLVRKVVEYQMYSLLLPTGDGYLRIGHSVGFSEAVVRSLRVPIGQGLTGRAALNRMTVRVDDVHKDPRYLRGVEAVRSEVAVPLIARDKLVAVLDLQSADPKAFDKRITAMLELIASRFSLAIDVAQLYRTQAKQHSTLQTLHQIAQEFSQILQLEELLQKIATLVRSLIRYDVLSIYLMEPERSLLKHYFGVKFQERVQWRDMDVGQGLVGRAARSRKPVLVADTSQDPQYIELTPSIRSEVAIPLVLKNELIGVLNLESERLSCFSAEDANTLMLLGPQIAAAIENARLYEEKALSEATLERDLIAARALQSSMLPDGEKRGPGIEIAARNEPASVVSGDFYDFYDIGDSIGLLNGDVSGKGAAAALYAALASGLLRAAVTTELPPGAALNRVNRALLDRRIEARFLAALFVVWSPGGRTLTMAGAGLPFPFVCRQGRVERVPLEGIPLGLFREAVYQDVSLSLQPGDMMVTVSDGFGDSLNAKREAYGEDRILGVLREHVGLDAKQMLSLLFEDVGRFSEAAPQVDDRTAVVLRVTD